MKGAGSAEVEIRSVTIGPGEYLQVNLDTRSPEDVVYLELRVTPKGLAEGFVESRDFQLQPFGVWYAIPEGGQERAADTQQG